jgi:hypothetical protein
VFIKRNNAQAAALSVKNKATEKVVWKMYSVDLLFSINIEY